ncbi:MAG: DUF4921 family protein, partial [Candidatus Bathyarchaeia archaeon]
LRECIYNQRFDVRKEREDYCSFCETRYFETPPEKSRFVKRDGWYEKLDRIAPDRYFDTVAEFRRVGNLFEIVSIDYWRKNYGYRMTSAMAQWRDEYLANPRGLKHVIDVLDYKMRQQGKSENEIEKITTEEKVSMAEAFFGGGHELIIARPHLKSGAEWDIDLFSSGHMTPEQHYQYFKFTIDAQREILENNHYVRYISVFQNWLRASGASFDHLHKQLVALDDWGSSIERQIRMLREDPNVFNERGANFAAYHNLIFAENDQAIAFVGIGHRFPTIEIYSRSQAGRPSEHSDEEIRGISNLVHTCHAAVGSEISHNEEWYYTPVDAISKMPWHVLIKLRINVPAGFEGGTSIYLNPLTPVDLRDKLVPRLYELRDRGIVIDLRIAEECQVHPNPLKYYLK